MNKVSATIGKAPKPRRWTALALPGRTPSMPWTPPCRTQAQSGVTNLKEHCLPWGSSKPLRAEKFRPQRTLNDKGLYATMKRWRIDPFCNIILPSNQPVPFPYHPVLWQGLSLCAYQPWKVRHTAWLSSALRQHFSRMWLLLPFLSLSHIQRERRLLPNCLESKKNIISNPTKGI